MSGIRDRLGKSSAFRPSLRFRLGLPLIIAALVLTGLWGYAGTSLVQDALNARAASEQASAAGQPVRALLTDVRQERLLTADWQRTGDESTREELDAARARTDEAAGSYHAAHAELRDTGAARELAASVTDALGGLAELRGGVDSGGVAADDSYRAYTEITSASTALFAVVLQTDAGELARGGAAVAGIAALGEALSRQAAVLERATTEESGQDAAEREFTQAVSLQREHRRSVDSQGLPGSAAAQYAALTGSEDWATLTAPENSEAGGVPELPENPDAWASAAQATSDELDTVVADALGDLVDGGHSTADGALLAAVLGTVAMLAALAGAAFLALRSWRSLSGRLSEIERRTRDQTERELPEITEKLAQPGSDPLAGSEPRQHEPDEIGRVAAATEEQWRTLVQTLVHQAQGRASTETVLLGLARRTQGLINRMIPKLDKLEREHQDSRLLKDIFAVDHLATRVRRHTENLLILGGSLPARRWGKPVPIYEVMRSAISETEDYSRVEALPAPAVSLTGRAVADVAHLVAELIENGTSFSPPETKVSVSAEVVARGRVALEIVDRGLGMSNEEYDRLNRLLADPPKLDMMTLGKAPRLGLLVVARLAHRHSLEVVLRKSPYGGTLAIVLLPTSLIEDAKPLLPDLMTDSVQTVDRADRPAPAEHPRPEHALAGANARVPGQAALPAGAATAGTESALPASAAIWDGSDGSGYPAYGGAGLLPPADSPATDPAPIASPLMDPLEHALAPSLSGGAGLLPPDTGGTNGHAAPGFAAGDQTEQLPSPVYQDFPMPQNTPQERGEAAWSAPPAEAPVDSWRAQEPAAAALPERRPEPRPGGPSPTAAAQARPARPVGGDPASDIIEGGSGLQLPVRVRGESLAEGLRSEQPPLARDGKGLTDAAPSPERAGRTIAAIQSGNRRARAAAAQSRGGHGPQAEQPRPGPDSDGTARKDQP